MADLLENNRDIAQTILDTDRAVPRCLVDESASGLRSVRALYPFEMNRLFGPVAEAVFFVICLFLGIHRFAMQMHIGRV